MSLKLEEVYLAHTSEVSVSKCLSILPKKKYRATPLYNFKFHDVRVPEQLQRAMAAEAEAAREARAKVIAAEGEHKASRALRHAAEVVADSPAALQLRYLQTLNSISAENNSTIIFPVPIDVISCIMGHSSANTQQQVTMTAETIILTILTTQIKAIRPQS